MKPKLNKKDQSKQNKLHEKLSLGQSLAGLFGGAQEQPGSDKDSEEVPVFMTEGIIPRPEIRKPKIPPKPGSKGRSTVSNRQAEKKIVPCLTGVPLPPYIVREGDTLESIAAEFGMTAEALKKLNNWSDEQAAQLKVGQLIRTL